MTPHTMQQHNTSADTYMAGHKDVDGAGISKEAHLRVASGAWQTINVRRHTSGMSSRSGHQQHNSGVRSTKAPGVPCYLGPRICLLCYTVLRCSTVHAAQTAGIGTSCTAPGVQHLALLTPCPPFPAPACPVPRLHLLLAPS